MWGRVVWRQHAKSQVVLVSQNTTGFSRLSPEKGLASSENETWTDPGAYATISKPWYPIVSNTHPSPPHPQPKRRSFSRLDTAAPVVGLEISWISARHVQPSRGSNIRVGALAQGRRPGRVQVATQSSRLWAGMCKDQRRDPTMWGLLSCCRRPV